MAILLNPESASTKELAKWEQFPSEFTPGGLRPGNPYVFRPYPRMLYMARQDPTNGKWGIYLDAPLNLSGPCTREVGSDEEYARARDEGWRDSPKEAQDYRDALEKAVGQAAAERNYRDRNMGEKAKAESAAAEADHFGHLPEIPEKPVVRRRKAS